MYKQSELMFLYTETSLHAGAGTGVGRIDLPIQREKHTHFPKIESSSLKGALREAYESREQQGEDKNQKAKNVRAIFGSAESENSGALALTDARLLFFPMRSAKGIFAWVTCPRSLQQFAQDLQMVDSQLFNTAAIPSISDYESILTTSSALEVDNQVMLEEFVFQAERMSSDTKELLHSLSNRFLTGSFFHGLFKSHVAIVDDQVFCSFVKLYTEVVTRNKINSDTGIVEDGALFTEEYLPPHSVLYSALLISDEFWYDKPMSAVDIKSGFHQVFEEGFVFQLGGNRTIGKGLMRMSFCSPTPVANP